MAGVSGGGVIMAAAWYSTFAIYDRLYWLLLFLCLAVYGTKWRNNESSVA